MSKVEKSIYIVLGIILIGIIAGGIVFISNDNAKNNDKIIINEEELQKYLSFVPLKDGEYRGAYEDKSTSLKEVNDIILLNSVFSRIACGEEIECPYDNTKAVKVNRVVACEFEDMCPPEGTITNNYVPLSYVNQELLKMYNYKLTDLKNAQSPEDIINIAGMAYYYEDGNFVALYGGSYFSVMHISYLDSYEATNDELIIFEYAAEFNLEDKSLTDYYTNNKKDLIGWCGNTTYDEYKSIVSKYLEDNKSDYSKYKHTFKKNNSSYYWVKTEVM